MTSGKCRLRCAQDQGGEAKKRGLHRMCQPCESRSLVQLLALLDRAAPKSLPCAWNSESHCDSAPSQPLRSEVKMELRADAAA